MHSARTLCTLLTGDLGELKALLKERDGELALLKERETALKRSLHAQSEKLGALQRKLELSETDRKITLVHAANSITRSRMMSRNKASAFHASGAAVVIAAMAAESARACSAEAAMAATAIVLANTGKAVSYSAESGGQRGARSESKFRRSRRSSCASGHGFVCCLGGDRASCRGHE
jgi:hypothetical protein